MVALSTGPQASGTPVETLQKLVAAAGLVITVRSSESVKDTVGAIVRAAPHLTHSHDIRADGLILSTIGLYRVFWGAVHCPGGSLAILVPLPADSGGEVSGWSRNFIGEVLDPVNSLKNSGFVVDAGGNGEVSDAEFARLFRLAHV